MNQRVKLLRNTLGLSGAKFGANIGVGRTAISLIESGKNSLTEQNIKSICREFNVNEDWLRHGEGDMFKSVDALPLDELISDLDPIELDILKAYFTLDKDIRKKAIDHFRSHLLKKD